MTNAPIAQPKVLGLADYASEDDDNAENDGSSDSDSSSDSSSDEGEVEAPAKPVTQSANSAKPVCRFFAKTGRCKLGAKCRFSHTVRPFDTSSALCR